MAMILYSLCLARKKLRSNLELAGVEVPDYPKRQHHIVAGTASGAENAREILTKFGIDIN